jgi:Protein of unknown function (DUF1565)
MTTRRYGVWNAVGMSLCMAWLVGTPGRASAATYVVDRAATGSADANPGTEEKPFRTVQHAADVAEAGDTVYVMAGR